MVLGVILMSITIINKDSFPDFDGDKYVQKADAKVHIGSDRTVSEMNE
jgi:hypothetical protein